TFNETAYFRWATFKTADFSGATFKTAYFSGATFNETAYFSGATFNETAYFSGATFNETAYFRWATFDGEATFISLKEAPTILFEGVSFKNPEKVVFDDFDLSNVSFVYTDISKVNFGERIRWDKNKKHIDERRADKGEVPYEVVATVYRRLRQNLESKMRYTEAGRFF
ncbi:MAG: pentapeptide repeat-containing protein, partial [Candidatus Bathyarchaeia archaeon]